MISIIKEDRPNYTLLLKVVHHSHDQRCEIAEAIMAEGDSDVYECGDYWVVIPNDDYNKDGYSVCPICGRLTNWDAACKKNRILRIVEGGGTITDELENPEFDGGADVGCWAVGATCWKKWLKATKEQANG